MDCYGHEVSYDLQGCCWESVTDASLIDAWMAKLPIQLGFKVLKGPITLPYFHEDAFESGITSTLILSTSHTALHTYPYGKKYSAYLSIFTCGQTDWDLANTLVLDFFKPKDYHRNMIERGKL